MVLSKRKAWSMSSCDSRDSNFSIFLITLEDLSIKRISAHGDMVFLSPEWISNKEVSYTNQFYIISLKNIVSGEIIYGRTKYDCDKGTLLFSAPNQTYTLKDIVISSESWFIAFHEDFIRGLDIQKRIKKFNYFNYNVIYNLWAWIK